MLRLSKKVDYGLMALMHLAQHQDRPSWKAREIAERYDIPTELMAKILQKMVQKGFLVSHHGMRGGYALARPADQISAAEVVEAIDGPLSLTRCLSDHGPCLQLDKCSVKSPLERLKDSVMEMLTQVTIARMNQLESIDWDSGFGKGDSSPSAATDRLTDEGSQTTLPVLQ